MAGRIRRWLFGCTEIVVGNKADVRPPPPGAAELGQAVLERCAKREAEVVTLHSGGRGDEGYNHDHEPDGEGGCRSCAARLDPDKRASLVAEITRVEREASSALAMPGAGSKAVKAASEFVGMFRHYIDWPTCDAPWCDSFAERNDAKGDRWCAKHFDDPSGWEPTDG